MFSQSAKREWPDCEKRETQNRNPNEQFISNSHFFISFSLSTETVHQSSATSKGNPSVTLLTRRQSRALTFDIEIDHIDKSKSKKKKNLLPSFFRILTLCAR
jgi:hypothetical protein